MKSKPASGTPTRSLGQKPAAQGGLKSSDSNYLKELPTRGLKIEMKSRVAEIIDHADLPSIDIEVRFDFDSAKIRDQSLPDLDALGRALSSPELSGARLLVNGHTDARGGEGYNMELSERRAESVREYLVSHYGISGKRLVAIGFGEERLKDRHDPEAAANRRVEIVNAGDM
ncbi:OmpA family protein [Hartmannibacter diazotrophicus]|uniref:OmpA family protein n=1 Tax=Hartmannibacter diazotrophicus TaxID=1482074 RepID=UPI0012FDD9E4|nr:OmpA family protein [Hartmannibacter diazotrophicus]